jgi:hypothetical protein
MKKTLIILSIFLIASCSSMRQGQTFLMVDKKPLKRVNSSQIWAEDNKIVQLTLTRAHLANLRESKSSAKGLVGGREILIYAKIYKDGYFQGYRMVTDNAEHMQNSASAVIEKPIFFTETIDSSYRIELKAYEVDATTLVKVLRRTEKTDFEVLESSAYAPGDAFTKGFSNIIFGLFDVVSSLSGRSVDDWVSKAGSDKIFEHSIYVTPTLDISSKENIADEQHYLIVGDADPDDKQAINLLKATDKSTTDKAIKTNVDAGVSALIAKVGPLTQSIITGMMISDELAGLPDYTYMSFHSIQK